VVGRSLLLPLLLQQSQLRQKGPLLLLQLLLVMLHLPNRQAKPRGSGCYDCYNMHCNARRGRGRRLLLQLLLTWRRSG
jgi:hypothetical protein